MPTRIRGRGDAEVTLVSRQQLELVLSGVIHDQNNLFQAMLALLSMAKQHISVQSPARKRLRALEDCTVRAAALAEKLRAYLTPTSSRAVLLDLNTVVRDACRSLEANRRDPLKLKIVVGAKPIWARVDAHGLLTAIHACAGLLLASPTPAHVHGQQSRETLELSVMELPENNAALIQLRYRGKKPVLLQPHQLELVGALLESCGIELLAAGWSEASVLSLSVPVADIGEGRPLRAENVRSDRPTDSVIEGALAEVLQDMQKLVVQLSRTSQGAARYG